MDSNTVRVLVFDWHWKLLGERTISVDDQALLPNNQLAWHRLCTVTMENIGVPYREIEHLPALERWFRGFWEMLVRYGFRIFAVEVPREHVRIGANQVVFDRTKVISKREMTLPS
jgi:hypothetical protein